MNALFHIASALALVLLAAWLLELQRQRALLRKVLVAAATGKAPVLDEPVAFMARVAKALGVPCENDAGVKAAPARLDLGPLAEFFSTARVSLIRWTNKNGVTVELHVAGTGANPDPGAGRGDALARALGGSVRVEVLHT